jgi:hypothetical protein
MRGNIWSALTLGYESEYMEKVSEARLSRPAAADKASSDLKIPYFMIMQNYICPNKTIFLQGKLYYAHKVQR